MRELGDEQLDWNNIEGIKVKLIFLITAGRSRMTFHHLQRDNYSTY